MFASLFFALIFAAASQPPAATPPPAGAATPAAAVTPFPVATAPLAPVNVFHQLTFGEQHPGLVLVIEALFLVATVGLIILMSVQTTKTEGLSGSIGGRAESAYRGRLGLDQQLTRITNVTAGAWIVLAIAYFLTTR